MVPIIPAWSFVLVVALFAFAAGLVVGIACAIWIRQAEDEESERREARRLHPVYDWRDELPSEWRHG